MAKWSILKQAIVNVIKTNGNQEITGAVLQNTLNSIVNSIGENAAFAGIATPTTNPGTPDGPIFYLAIKAGIYSNFNYVITNDNLTVLYWDGAKWTITGLDISSATKEKRERLKSIVKLPPSGASAIIEDDKVNLLRNTSFTNGVFLNRNTGLEEKSDNLSYSDYIDVSNISLLQVSSASYNGGCFYDENKVFISGYGISDLGYSHGQVQNLIAEVPSNAKYVRINVGIGERLRNIAYAIDYNLSPSKVKYPWLYISVPKKLLTHIGISYGYMLDDGSIKATPLSEGNFITKYDVTKIKSVFISLSEDIPYETVPRRCVLWIVDKSNKPILMSTVNAPRSVLNNYYLTIPKNGEQLWVQSKNPEVYTSVDVVPAIKEIRENIAELQNNKVRTINPWAGKKIIWLGTSNPYGAGADSSSTTYPMLIGKKLGATVINTSRPGMSIATTADFKRLYQGSLSLTIAELQSEGAAITPYQSYENAMLGQDGDLYVFDCELDGSNFDLPGLKNFNVDKWAYDDGSSFESHRNTYVGALLFLLDKLWTEKPSAKVVFVSEYMDQYRFGGKYNGLTASKAVAEKLKIPLLNVTDKLYCNPLNASVYVNARQLTQAAHDRIANILATELLSIN